MNELKQQIAEFEKYKESVERQQLTYPLDEISYDLVHKDIPVPTGMLVEPYGIIGFPDAPEVSINGVKYFLMASIPY